MSALPQVVFIMTDTQRFDMVGCNGNREMKTPVLDRLASQGIRFERAYTCQPVCGPARSAIFTGTWPHTNGSWANDLPMGANFKTLGQQVRDAGIAAGYVGKWHLDSCDYFGRGKPADGWDPAYWYDMRNYLEELPADQRPRTRTVKTNRDPNLTAEFTFGHRVSNRAIDFLEHHQGKPFCLVVSYDEPHDPFLCPRPWSEMYRGYQFPQPANVRDALADKPEHHRVWAERAREAGGYINDLADFLGCNSFIDHEIGRVIAAIDRLAPNALVIYTSDHGEALTSHQLFGKGPAMYEQITHIPMIVRWPGVAPAGNACAQLMSHIDITPTILDALGIAPSKLTQGQSMLPTYRNPAGPAQHSEIFIEFGRYELQHDGFGGFQPVRAAFDGRHKLVINLLTSDELYDLQKDPAEMSNLISSPEHASARDRLHDKLLDWMNYTRDPFRGYYWHRRPWRADAPAATWWYTGYTRQVEAEAGEGPWLDYHTGHPVPALFRKQ